jgi:hypothetical protein
MFTIFFSLSSSDIAPDFSDTFPKQFICSIAFIGIFLFPSLFMNSSVLSFLDNIPFELIYNGCFIFIHLLFLV